MNIKAAVDYYNSHKEELQPKMTMASLAESVMPKYKGSSAKHNMSMWNQGNRYQILKASIIKRICEETGVDADFLFMGIDVTKKEFGEADASGAITIMKLTGMKPNEVFNIKSMH